MGCSPSGHIIVDTSLPVFHVWNIDEQGKRVKSCHIQVTSTDLVLHQRGESPVLWPLRSLRRYGFDTELFSFECGRHCSTGHGIYAFKCRKAELLFNTLQESIQNISESDLGLSSLNGPEANGSTASGEMEETDNLLGQQIDGTDYGAESQPSTSTGIKKLDAPKSDVVPTAPEESISTISTISTQSIVTKSCFPTLLKSSPPVQSKTLPRSLRCLPPSFGKNIYEPPSQMLPRCCTIGTCINASKQHYMNEKAMQSTTCGSCRTCSLNMCVVRPYVNSGMATDIEERARQTDYGNVLDPGGMPRQCVHCCCDFKPSKPMSSCSADNCPLHFNNCVDQVTNYARLDKHKKEYSANLKLRKRFSSLQPVNFSSYAHLYNNIPTPTKKWPISESRTRSPSWRSLPHFQTMSSFSKIAPKRSISHFYSDTRSTVTEKAKKFFTGHQRKGDEQRKVPTSLNLGVPGACALPVTPEAISLEASEEFAEKDECDSIKNGAEGYDAGDFKKTELLSKSISSIVLVDDELVRKTLQYGSLSSASS